MQVQSAELHGQMIPQSIWGKKENTIHYVCDVISCLVRGRAPLHWGQRIVNDQLMEEYKVLGLASIWDNAEDFYSTLIPQRAPRRINWGLRCKRPKGPVSPSACFCHSHLFAAAFLKNRGRICNSPSQSLCLEPNLKKASGEFWIPLSIWRCSAF